MNFFTQPLALLHVTPSINPELTRKGGEVSASPATVINAIDIILASFGPEDLDAAASTPHSGRPPIPPLLHRR